MKQGRAFDRAVQRFGECALYVRGEIRACGGRGELRRLDDYVSGTRGRGFAAFLADFAGYCAEHGMPAERVAAHLGALTADVVADVYADPNRAA